MKLTRRTLFGAGLSLVAGTASAADGPLARIAAARALMRTLRGPFTQTRVISLLATHVRSRGMLTLVRPDRLRWDIAPPDDVTFWVGPEGLTYRGPHGIARIPSSRTSSLNTLEDLQTLLGGDLEQLLVRWRVDVVRDDAAGVQLEATAKEDAGTSIRRVRLTLARDLVRPTNVIVFEGERDQSIIDFGPLALDAPVADAEMRAPA